MRCCVRTPKSAPTTRRSEGAAAHVLPDVLAPGLSIVFCGTAPGHVSAARGAYYAHPQNRFWRSLHEVGLTPNLLRPEDYALMPGFGLGLTDIAKRDRGMEKPRDLVGSRLRREKRERCRGLSRGGRGRQHARNLRERGWGGPGGALSSSSRVSTPSRPSSSSRERWK